MTLLLVSLAVLVVFGAAALVCGKAQTAHALGSTGAIAGGLIGLVPAAQTLLGGTDSTIALGWGGFGQAHLGLDPLSAFFLLPVFGLSAVGAVYGTEYLAHSQRPVTLHWFFYDLLVASMAAVVVARDGLAFLVAWEAMALSSFFLVATDADKAQVREASWVYLVATHLGTAFLLPFFLILGQRSGSLEFSAFAARSAELSPALGAALFVFAVVGFGTKAGFMPVHVWLPEAHPAAPSHVSAVMSGVMIKTGVYGLLRALSFCGPPAPWWGYLLVAVGIFSAVVGVLFALAQQDLKRMLAYSSVENVGIITLGIGLGLVGYTRGQPTLAALGFAGALLHALNHSLFKGLLFLGAGAVLHAAGTGDMDRLGGLLKRMPRAGALFALGAVAICGLPPLNGFVGEALLYVAAFAPGSDAGMVSPGPALSKLSAIGGLALTGGLAAAAFTKAFGITFLGTPRSQAPAQAHEPGRRMLGSMAVLAALCVAAGLGAPFLVALARRALAGFAWAGEAAPVALGEAQGWLLSVTLAAAATWLVGLALALARRRLLRGRPVAEAGTWDCGFAGSSPRVQYTGSSFADPVVRVFFPFLRTRQKLQLPKGYFPVAASLETHTADFGQERLFAPVFAATRQLLGRLAFLQQGGMHRYVMFIALTLVVLLVWKL